MYKNNRSISASFLWLLLALSITPIANAQISSSTEEAREGEEIRGDTKVAEIREVERGIYTAIGFGANYYLPFLNDTLPLNEDKLSPGTRMDLRVGYDIKDVVSAEFFVLANFNTGLLDPDAVTSGKLTGDIAHIAPGIAARFAFFSTERWFVHARGGVGYAFWFPSELAGDSLGSFHLEGDIGAEYYTRLRHISIGIEAGVQALLAPTAIGLHITPTIKYTF